MTTRMIALAAPPHSARLLVAHHNEGSFGPADDQLTIELVDADGDIVASRPVGRWRRTGLRTRANDPEEFLHWAKPTIEGLDPGTRYRAHLIDRRRLPVASAVITTAPAPDTDHLRLAAGSCFDVNGNHRGVLGRAYRKLVDPADPTPTYNLWLGDQVYVDAPWEEVLVTVRMRRIIFGRYLKTWGLDPEIPLDETLHPALSSSTNWFLPDDHEFWNGYPKPSWLTLFGHTVRRAAVQVWRLRHPEVPTHPSAQGPWGSTAGEAFCLFASPLELDRFDEAGSPDQIQTIETDRVVVALVDTRWRRTIRKKVKGARFMDADDLTRLTELLRTDERLVCVALSKPIVGALPHVGLTRGKVEYGPEDYPEQYNELWRALTHRRRAGLPTVTIGGDVHHHAIRTALEDGLLEVVSSPLSLLKALDSDSPINRARSTWRSVRNGLGTVWKGIKVAIRRTENALTGREEADESTAYPTFVDDSDAWETAYGTLHFEDVPIGRKDGAHRKDSPEPSGLATLDIRSDDTGHTVTVTFALARAEDPIEPRSEQRAFRWDATGSEAPAWHKL